MFTHVVLGMNDVAASKDFYDAVLSTIGIEKGAMVPHEFERFIYIHNGQFLVITQPINGEAATYGNGMTIGFQAETPEQVDQFYKTALELGGVSEGAPVKKSTALFDVYVAYVRDLTGNKLSVSCRL